MNCLKVSLDRVMLCSQPIERQAEPIASSSSAAKAAAQPPCEACLAVAVLRQCAPAISRFGDVGPVCTPAWYDDGFALPMEVKTRIGD